MATAFLFDMDGTLLDSEPSHFAAWRKAVEETGSDNSFLTDEYFSEWIGNPDVEGFCRACIDNHGVTNTTPAEMAKAKLAAFLTVADAHIFEGVVEQLEGLAGAAKIPLQLCTGSHRDACAALLDGTPLAAVFPIEARTTFNDVSEQKPAAAPYLRAAGLAGVDPANCIAFEDSPAGLNSATAAGCGERLGIMTSYDDAALRAAGATQVFKNTVDAIEWAKAKAAVAASK